MSAPAIYPKNKEEIVVRYAGNPILTAKDVPAAANGVYNSGCIKTGKSSYVMLCRVESPAMKQFLWPADSTDGIKFKLRPEPIKMPDTPEFREYTTGMFYDPRVTKIDGKYYVVFACHSGHSCRLGLMESADMKEFNWVDFISQTDNRNGVLFPEKINGYYCRLDRPNTSDGRAYMWISYSPDLVHWGRSKALAVAQDEWGWKKNGPGAVPIKTDKGWLVIYHAVNVQCAAQYVYHLGVMMLDLKDPSKIIARAKAPILSPKTDYELNGLSYAVVFTAGAVVEDNGEVKIYYGGADRVQCLATAKLEDLIDACYNR
ncbi:MAG: glycoside hydrolase family 130 protein [Candidatus Omnitrophica bacterium]|nr:glycoside hydrolase family 130 protein [Candidatus Omnitrophota bacterium]MDD4013043.1 glycoside hydrolase family 130 protein [Candidatus Omnitrophota bacterium]